MQFQTNQAFTLFRFKKYAISVVGKRTFYVNCTSGKWYIMDLDELRKLPELKNIKLEVSSETK
jgi:hypothetical protein